MPEIYMIGQTLSRCDILEKLSEDGMGGVYRARDTKLDRDFAIKFLSASHIATEQDKTRFIHEACAASTLEHSNICAIYEIDETSGGQLFLSIPSDESEFIERKNHSSGEGGKRVDRYYCSRSGLGILKK